MTQIVNGLQVTAARRALLRATTEPGRIYYEPAAKNAYDKASGRKVTAALNELVRAGWIRVARDDEQRPGESKYLTYYRPVYAVGRTVLKGEAR